MNKIIFIISICCFYFTPSFSQDSTRFSYFYKSDFFFFRNYGLEEFSYPKQPCSFINSAGIRISTSGNVGLTLGLGYAILDYYNKGSIDFINSTIDKNEYWCRHSGLKAGFDYQKLFGKIGFDISINTLSILTPGNINNEFHRKYHILLDACIGPAFKYRNITFSVNFLSGVYYIFQTDEYPTANGISFQLLFSKK